MTARSNIADAQLTGLLGDFRLLLILFITFRLLLLIVYQPLVVEGVERGLSAGGDYAYYYALGELTGDGLLPFRDWWTEHPPLFPLLMTGIYGLSNSYIGFAMLLGFVILAFDTGNLVLVRAIGARLYTPITGMTLAWIYAVTLAPMVMVWWNYEPIAAFFMLLGLWYLLRGRETRSAVAAALGVLTKFTPVMLAGAVWRFRSQMVAIRYCAVLVVIVAAVYGLLMLQSAEMTLPSLISQFNKASYQTVWALIDGNYRTGNFGSVMSHFDPAQAMVLYGNPAVVPGWLRLGIALLIGLWVFARTRRFDDRGLVAFVSIALLIFYLQAQGFSTQWLTQIIPLVLLCFPTRNGVLIVILLSFVSFAEYPMLFLRTGDTGGEITGALRTPFALLIFARTGLLILLCVMLYRKLRQEPIV